MAYKLFDCTGLFETFKIPKYEFVNFMMALENGYKSIPCKSKPIWQNRLQYHSVVKLVQSQFFVAI